MKTIVESSGGNRAARYSTDPNETGSIWAGSWMDHRSPERLRFELRATRVSSKPLFGLLAADSLQ